MGKQLDVHPRQAFINDLILRGESAVQLPPMPSLKGWSGTGRLSNEGGSSPNQCKLSRTAYLAGAVLGGRRSQLDEAIAVNVAFYRDMEKAGHWCIPRGGGGEGRAVEFGTIGHGHQWLNGETTDWLCSLELGGKGDELRKLVVADLRIQSALMGECRYVSAEGKTRGKARYLTPGARNKQHGARSLPETEDDCLDRWGRWVLDGDPWTPRNGDQFYTALHALRRAEAWAAITPWSLSGTSSDLGPTAARFGLNVTRESTGGFYAWVTTLREHADDLVLNPCHGVGYLNGAPVYEWDAAPAAARGDEMRRAA